MGPLPSTCRGRSTRRGSISHGGAGTLRFGLHASYALLDALGHPLGRRYAARAAELRDVLAVRNNSLLVHGWCPVDEATFQRLLSITLDFLQLGVEELPKLPSLPEAA